VWTYDASAAAFSWIATASSGWRAPCPAVKLTHPAAGHGPNPAGTGFGAVETSSGHGSVTAFLRSCLFSAGVHRLFILLRSAFAARPGKALTCDATPAPAAGNPNRTHSGPSRWSSSYRSNGQVPGKLLEIYLAEISERYTQDTTASPRAWAVFDHLVEFGGSTSPGDFADFDFESNQAMRPHVKNLEDANLVTSAVDDTDRRRKTIVIAPRGWFVQYHRSGYTVRG
jgi:hypothetical protein